MKVIQDLLTSKRNRPYLRSKAYNIRKLKGIVIHYTANYNKGANAKANRNYFNTTDRYASAHYLVDSKQIIQCIPDNEVAYHVGGKYYTKIGKKIKTSKLTPNYFLIGIEMCVNTDESFKEVTKNTISLVKNLLKKYPELTIRDIYRHYDITGKLCPIMYIDDEIWNDFKEQMKPKKVIRKDPTNEIIGRQMIQIIKNTIRNIFGNDKT